MRQTQIQIQIQIPIRGSEKRATNKRGKRKDQDH